MKHNISLIGAIIALTLSLAANFYFFTNESSGKGVCTYKSPEAAEQPLPLISPLKQTEISESPEVLHYTYLKPKLEEAIKNAREVQDVGIFLQDSRSGAWFGINEKTGFIPASLLKVPIMMAVLKKQEREEIKMTDEIELLPDDLNDAYGDLYKKGAGTKLTYWELIKKMILASDNTAKNALERQLSDEELNAIFVHVGIPNPYRGTDTARQMITPREYIRIFKSLYFSTFLTPALSQKALDLTTDTEEEGLISAGVPPEVQVAHKFGENAKGVSDCGIVYHSESPYFLCIMVKTEKVEGRTIIKDLSKIIYDSIEEHQASPD